jgi:hypothetical protein
MGRDCAKTPGRSDPGRNHARPGRDRSFVLRRWLITLSRLAGRHVIVQERATTPRKS